MSSEEQSVGNASQVDAETGEVVYEAGDKAPCEKTRKTNNVTSSEMEDEAVQESCKEESDMAPNEMGPCCSMGLSSSTEIQREKTTNNLDDDGDGELTQGFIVKKYKKLKKVKKVYDVVKLHPMAPEIGTYSDHSCLSKISKIIQDYKKRQIRNTESTNPFMKVPFTFPVRTEPKTPPPRHVDCNLDTVGNLLMAHATVDAELAAWARTVEKGFQKRETEDAVECERVETQGKRRRQEVKELKEKTNKMRIKYERISGQMEREEKEVSSTQDQYHFWQECIDNEVMQPRVVGETHELLARIQHIREEKLENQWKNDELERSNQELRETVAELGDRCMECREDDHPRSRLKPKTKKMFRELMALGVPKKSLDHVVKRIIGLEDFRVIGLPTAREIDRLGQGMDDDEDEIT